MAVGSLECEDYLLTCIRTDGATGYFECVPAQAPDFDRALALSRSRPNDEFMRRYLLRLIAAWQPQELKHRIAKTTAEDCFLRALFAEACLLIARFAHLRAAFSVGARQLLAQSSPLPYMRATQQKDHALHARWMQYLQPNFTAHIPLPAPSQTRLPPPVSSAAVTQALSVRQTLEHLAAQFNPALPATAPPGTTPEELHALALERLARAGIAVEREMRHEASLSPIALLRKWQLSVRVRSGRHNYRLSGEQTAYGRGLDLEAARVACVMEIVERVSAYATIVDERLPEYRNTPRLLQAPWSEMRKQGCRALDPNRLGLPTPYADEPLFWVEGRTPAPDGPQPIWVPAQAVFLFCNLDEIKLSSSFGSNGLGAGASLAEAKQKALLEIIERDCAAVIPYTETLCFEVETADERLARLLRSYREQGIAVGFQDITGPMGVPCCKCFVQHNNGSIAAGTGAHLDARRALVAALTETPYPYPGGPPSRALPPAGVQVPLEALPNYDRGGPEQNLTLLEELLRVNGFTPIYVDLTRTDLALPVVRALVPGMELSGDFDRFARVHPRLYGNYLKYAATSEATGSGAPTA